jgi:hypothetical protein
VTIPKNYQNYCSLENDIDFVIGARVELRENSMTPQQVLKLVTTTNALLI